MKPAAEGGALVLIPWHIGNRLDVTVRAVRQARALRVLLAEEPELTRRQFETELGVDCRGKEFLPIPPEPDRRWLETVLGHLRAGDAGLVCSGGIPCFIDPGGWVVAALRERGVPVVALPGPSILSTMLSLSGYEWPRDRSRGTFVVFLSNDPEDINKRRFLDTFRRRAEPIFVFLVVDQFRECVDMMTPVLGARPVSAFFDLTKVPRSRFPYADRVTTFPCSAWAKEAGKIRWDQVSDVALMIHPEEKE